MGGLFQGELVFTKPFWDSTKWPDYRGGHISGVQIRGGSPYYPHTTYHFLGMPWFPSRTASRYQDSTPYRTAFHSRPNRDRTVRGISNYRNRETIPYSGTYIHYGAAPLIRILYPSGVWDGQWEPCVLIGIPVS